MSQQKKTPVKPLPPRLHAALSAMELHLARREWVEARQGLEELNRQFPRRVEILEMWTEACALLNDFQGYEHAGLLLVELLPGDAEVCFNLGMACLKNMHPALGMHYLRRFLLKWPEHAKAADARDVVNGLEPKVQKACGELGFPLGETEELAVLHERVHSYLGSGRYQEALSLAKDLTRKAPFLTAGWNNLAQAQVIAGQPDAAMASLRRTLEIDPQNVHALSNLVRFHLLAGATSEALRASQALREAPAHGNEVLLKKAEAFAYLGDDEAVLQVLETARRAKVLPRPGEDPLLYHLSAVAFARRGDEGNARKFWNLALKVAPGHPLALANLEDFKGERGERHSPWPFSFANWIDEKVIGELSATARKHPRAREAVLQRILRAWLVSHPEVESLIPALLDRGDEDGREFAMKLVEAVRTPPLLEAARDFALGQRGPDTMRHLAAQMVFKAGLIENPVRLWWDGEWRELRLVEFDIHNEPERHENKIAIERAERGSDALESGQFELAEELYRQALEMEPDAPVFKNDLAAVLLMTNRADEAIKMIREIVASHPEYFFARVSLARFELRQGNIIRARELLAPLQTMKRFHISEFRTWAQVHIELALHEKQKDSALSWLDLWKDAAPDDPSILAFATKIERA